jgi:hypothetical protein
MIVDLKTLKVTIVTELRIKIHGQFQRFVQFFFIKLFHGECFANGGGGRPLFHLYETPTSKRTVIL